MSLTLELFISVGKNHSENVTFHTQYSSKSHLQEDVRNIWTVDIGTIELFFGVSNQLGKFSMETVLSGQWWRSHQSFAWFMSKMSDPAQFDGRIIFMLMFNDIIWRKEIMKRNVLLIPHFYLDLKKDFQQDIGHSSDLGQKRSGIPFTEKDQEVNGTKSLNWWRKRTPSFPSHVSIVSRDAQKQRRWKKYLYTFVSMEIRLKLFFAQFFFNELSIYRAVFDLCEEHNSCRTSTERPVLTEQSDRLFEPANLLITTPTPSFEIHAQENLLLKHKERVERLSQHNEVKKLVLVHDAWQRLTWDCTSWQKTLESPHNFQDQWPVLSTSCHETKNQATRNVVFQVAPNLDPYW